MIRSTQFCDQYLAKLNMGLIRYIRSFFPSGIWDRERRLTCWHYLHKDCRIHQAGSDWLAKQNVREKGHGKETINGQRQRAGKVANGITAVSALINMLFSPTDSVFGPGAKKRRDCFCRCHCYFCYFSHICSYTCSYVKWTLTENGCK